MPQKPMRNPGKWLSQSKKSQSLRDMWQRRYEEGNMERGKNPWILQKLRGNLGMQLKRHYKNILQSTRKTSFCKGFASAKAMQKCQTSWQICQQKEQEQYFLWKQVGHTAAESSFFQIVHGKLQSVTWHVNDLKSSHVDSKVSNDLQNGWNTK